MTYYCCVLDLLYATLLLCVGFAVCHITVVCSGVVTV